MLPSGARGSGGNAVPMEAPAREPGVTDTVEVHRVTRAGDGEGANPEASPRERRPLARVQVEVVRRPSDPKSIEHGLEVRGEDGIYHFLNCVDRNVRPSVLHVPTEEGDRPKAPGVRTEDPFDAVVAGGTGDLFAGAARRYDEHRAVREAAQEGVDA